MKQNKCLDCGKEISKSSKRCKPCSNNFRAGKYEKKGYKMEKSSYWRGGISIYRRLIDKCKCELCKGDKNLVVHHKDKDRHNNKLENLSVLCRSCHAKVHKLYKNFFKNNGDKNAN